MNHLQTLLLTFLLNALWQIPILFAGAALAARLLRERSPRWIYRLWIGALLLEVSTPFLSLCSWSVLGLLRGLLLRSRPSPAATTGIVFGVGSSASGSHVAATLLFALSAVYIGAVLFSALKLLWGIHRIYSLRRNASPITLNSAANSFWIRCCQQFGTSGAFLAESVEVTSPLTLGWRRKLVLLPASLLSAIDLSELEVVLAHEAAHMRRNDFAVNLLLESISLPISFHPFLRLTRARLVESREWVCDDLAAEAVARPHLYARSLVRLASLLLQSGATPIPHAIGILDSNALERRIMHLTRKPQQWSLARRITSVSACAVLALATTGSALAFRTNLAEPLPQDTPATPKAVRISPGVMAGNILSRVNPVYPQEAKEAGIQGSVVLHAVISREGSIESLSVLSGPQELQAAALDAVHQWTYKPFLLNGEPVDVETTITVNFMLNK